MSYITERVAITSPTSKTYYQGLYPKMPPSLSLTSLSALMEKQFTFQQSISTSLLLNLHQSQALQRQLLLNTPNSTSSIIISHKEKQPIQDHS